MILVRRAEPSDVEDVAALAERMNRFYGATETAEIEPVRLRAQINEAIFGPTPFAHALLAWDKEKPVGIAAYSYLWPAVGLTRSLFLKELFVRESARCRGVGRQLMRALFEIALSEGCSRVEWQTETANAGARAFYAGLGTSEFAEKVSYRLEGEPLRTAFDAISARSLRQEF